MEITSLTNIYKLFIPLLPYLKKIIIIETFFSLSADKKAEAVDFLIENVNEASSLNKYKQELKLSHYKLCDDFQMSIYILEYFLANKKEHGRFCKSLVLVKGFYEYKNAEVNVKKNILWLPFVMFVVGVLSGWGGIMAWINITASPLKWLFIGGCSLICIQYIYYAVYCLLHYINLRGKVKDFNFFVTLYRLDKTLNKLI
ncbi:hypothetical protein RM351_001078 [Enterobacter kobei]|uniref:hypothetical protein n=1 Tax=Enterobacter kobei TaxID=208224 RepID=UPI00125274D2|nr:hypothetical protein [Enterobacter kobei]ELE9235812.1 hypothetical protein [Enterobacter kobei]VAL45900.1 Uncharacterised protein [Enterobacter kobei]